jgi:hypothetical protein
MGLETYASEVELPSRSLAYNGKLGSHVWVFPWTAQEEKLLAGIQTSPFEEVLDLLLQSSIKQKKEDGTFGPLPFPAKDLLLGDRTYLLIMMVAVSYGGHYEWSTACPDCRKRFSGSTELDALPVRYLEEGWTEPFQVTLPISGAVVSCRLLRGKDETEIARYAKQRQNIDQSPGDPAYLYRLVRHIVAVAKATGEVSPQLVAFETSQKDGPLHAQRFVDNLLAGDSLELRNGIDAKDCGPDMNLVMTCRNCGREVSLVMPLTADFFRPKSYRGKRSPSGAIPAGLP